MLPRAQSILLMLLIRFQGLYCARQLRSLAPLCSILLKLLACYPHVSLAAWKLHLTRLCFIERPCFYFYIITASTDPKFGWHMMYVCFSLNRAYTCVDTS